MEKNIYGLLNEIEMDFTEYEDLELSSVEKEAYKQRILQEVSRMKQNKEQRTRKTIRWKRAASVAAACVLLVGAIGVANPILAKNIFGSVFGKLIDNAKGEKDEKEYTDLYTKIGEKSVEVKEELEKHQDEAYTTTASDNGVTISVSDLYCDGYVLYYTAALKTDNEELKRADGICAETKRGMEAIKIEGVDLSGYSSRAFEKSEDGSFVTADQISLMEEQAEGTFAKNEGTLVVDWTITNLRGNLWDSWDENGEYEVTASVDGEWHLRFPVTIDESQNETFAIDKEENDVVVKEAVKTKAGLVIHVKLPDFRKDPYNDPYNDPNLAIKDAQGNYLQWMSQRGKENADGTSESWIMVLYDGEKDLSFEVTTRDKNEYEIAKIAFQIP